MTSFHGQDGDTAPSDAPHLTRRAAMVLIGGAVSTLAACGGGSGANVVENTSSSSGGSSGATGSSSGSSSSSSSSGASSSSSSSSSSSGASSSSSSSSSSSGASSSSSSSGTSSSSGSGAGAISVVQWAQQDPNPSNLDSYFNGASTSGSPQMGLSQAGYYNSDTAAGNTLLCIATIATDYNPFNGLGNSIVSVQDPVNGPWRLLGTLDNTTDANCEIKVYVKFNAQPLLATSWSGSGSNNGSGVLTIGSGSGTLRLGQRINSAHTPQPTNMGGETVIVSLLSGTLGASGSTYKLSRADAAFGSEAMTSTDFVSQTRSQVFSFTDYPGMFLAELSGTDGSSAYFSGNNDAPTAAGIDTVTSGMLSMPASAGILFGFGFNGGINNSNPFPPLYAPRAGTGFGTSHAILQYDQGNPICTVEWQHFASLGSRAATFSPNADSRFATVGVAFLDR